MLQLIVGTLLSAVFLLFQVQASPYVAMADDFLASAASFGLVAIFLCSIAFKVKCGEEAQRPLALASKPTLTCGHRP